MTSKNVEVTRDYYDSQKVIKGNFEQLPFQDNTYDFVWSQDAILHSGDRFQVLQEVHRVLKANGEFIFADIMQNNDCPQELLKPVLERIHLSSLGSVKFYQEKAHSLGFETIEFIDLSPQLVAHYSAILKQVNDKYQELLEICGGYIDAQKIGLNHWIDSGKKGLLQWGILHFRKI